MSVSRKEDRSTCECTSQVTQLNLTFTLDRALPRNSYRTYRKNSIPLKPHRITQLPAEIFAHIFVLGAEDDVRLPVVVSHVCRMWRAVALHTPSLWAHVSLDSRRKMWTERIQRAKAAPLDIEIRPQTQTGRKSLRRNYLTARAVESYMHLAAPLISRWRSLTIEFQHYAPYLWNAALSECCAPDEYAEAPSLEAISLVHPQNDDGKEFLLFNGCAPQLRSATLQGIRLIWLPTLFANLTTLDYTHHGFTQGYDCFVELFGMLSVSSRLQDLRLSFPPSSPHAFRSQSLEIPAHARIHLNDLRTLTLHVSADDIPSALVELIARLRLRHVRSLSLLAPAPAALSPSHRHYYDPRMMAPPFVRLRPFFEALPRLSELMQLRVEYSWCDATFVQSLLKFHVPQLKHLALVSPHVNDQFLWSLGEELRGRNYYVGHLDMEEYVPGVWHGGSVTLSTLDVLEIGGARISDEGLVTVVRRMLGGGIQWVQEVWIKDCKAVDSTVMERAGRFGVNVRLWNGDVEVEDDSEKSASPGRPRKNSMWNRLCR